MMVNQNWALKINSGNLILVCGGEAGGGGAAGLAGGSIGGADGCSEMAGPEGTKGGCGGPVVSGPAFSSLARPSSFAVTSSREAFIWPMSLFIRPMRSSRDLSPGSFMPLRWC